MPKISSIRIIEASSATDNAPTALADDLAWVQKRGVDVERLPQEGVQHVASAATLSVQHPLPLVLVDGKVALSGRYPTREEMGIWMMFGLMLPEEKNSGGIRACTL